jgi:hypothetical protein
MQATWYLPTTLVGGALLVRRGATAVRRRRGRLVAAPSDQPTRR